MRTGMALQGKRVLVVGLARTGVATALFCAARGAQVSATEQRSAAELGETVGRISSCQAPEFAQIIPVWRRRGRRAFPYGVKPSWPGAS
jgi:NAD(P)-dependent dehydrogenase (short-subunit alcohol dehydrogenase family)